MEHETKDNAADAAARSLAWAPMWPRDHELRGGSVLYAQRAGADADLAGADAPWAGAAALLVLAAGLGLVLLDAAGGAAPDLVAS